MAQVDKVIAWHEARAKARAYVARRRPTVAMDANNEAALHRAFAEVVAALRAERDRYRGALERIAAADDGWDREDYHIGVARSALSGSPNQTEQP